MTGPAPLRLPPFLPSFPGGEAYSRLLDALLQQPDIHERIEGLSRLHAHAGDDSPTATTIHDELQRLASARGTGETIPRGAVTGILEEYRRRKAGPSYEQSVVSGLQRSGHAAPPDVQPPRPDPVATGMIPPLSNRNPPALAHGHRPTEEDRLAQTEADRLLEESRQLGERPKLPADVAAGGGFTTPGSASDRPRDSRVHLRDLMPGAGRAAMRAAIGYTKGSGALAEDLVQLGAAGKQRVMGETPHRVETGYGRAVGRLEELGAEGLYTPGVPETVGEYAALIPGAAVAEHAIAGPITKMLVKRLAARGLGPIARSIIGGAAHTALTAGPTIGGQVTVEESARGTPFPEALSRGVEAGGAAVDPRDWRNLGFYAAGIFGKVASTLGRIERAGGKGLGYSERLRNVLEERAARERGRPFGPVFPEEMQQARTEVLAPEVPGTPGPIERRTVRRMNEPARPIESRVPPGTILGGTEEELNARRPKYGEPGVLPESSPEDQELARRLTRHLDEHPERATRHIPDVEGHEFISGPIAQALGNRRAPLALGLAGGAYGAAHGNSPEERALNALIFSTAASGIAASLGRRRGGALRSGPLFTDIEEGGSTPRYYSRMRRAFEGMKGAQTPAQVEAMIQRGAFSKMEFDHVIRPQIAELDPQKSIARDQWLAMADRGALKVSERVYGGPRPTDTGAAAQRAHEQAVARLTEAQEAFAEGLRAANPGISDAAMERAERKIREGYDTGIILRDSAHGGLGRDVAIPMDLQRRAEELLVRSNDADRTSAARRSAGSAPQHPTLTLPGGEGYREITISVEPKRGDKPYRGGHYSGAMAWIRGGVHEIEGKKRFITYEDQSDVQQTRRDLRISERKASDGSDLFVLEDKRPSPSGPEWHTVSRYTTRDEAVAALNERAPPLPYQKTEEWVSLLVRRQIEEAVRDGLSGIGWVTGRSAHVAEHHQLAEAADRLEVQPFTSGGDKPREMYNLRAYRGRERVVSHEIPVADLHLYVGRDAAVALTKRSQAAADHVGSVTTQELHPDHPQLFPPIGNDSERTGGHYKYNDDIRVGIVRDVFKKLGVKVEPRRIPTEPLPHVDPASLVAPPEPQPTPLHEIIENSELTDTQFREAYREQLRNGRWPVAVREFLDEMWSNLGGEQNGRAEIDDALDRARETAIEAEVDQRRQNYEPDIPDIDWFEEGARDYVEQEYGTPLRDAVKDIYQTATNPDLFARGPTREAQRVTMTAEQIVAVIDEGHFDSPVEEALHNILEQMDTEEPISRRDMERAVDDIIEEKVRDQAETDREHYEPEPPDEQEAFINPATEEVDATVERVRDLLDRAEGGLVTPPGPQMPELPVPANDVWVADFPEGFAEKVKEGLPIGRADTRLLTTIAGAGVGAAAGAKKDEKHRLRGAIAGGLAGAAAGLAGPGLISRALRSRRGGAAATMPIEARPEPVPPPERPTLQVVRGGQVPARRAAQPGGAPVEPPVDPASYANFAKFDLDPTGETRLRAEIERVVTETGIHPKNVVSHQEVRRAAGQLGLDIDASDQSVNRRISGARLLGIRNIISANIEAQERMAGELARPTEVSAERAAEISHRMAVLDQQNAHLLEQFVRARTAAGRELNALKIVANRSLDPAVWWAKARSVAGRDLTAEELATVRRFVEERDRAGLITFVSGLHRSTVGEQLTTLWKAGLLTNPKTHMVNTVGNTAMAALETAKDPVAAGADWLLSLRTGQRAKGGLNRFLAQASLQGVRRGIVEARDVLKGRIVGEELERGVRPRETTIDLPGLPKGANALLDGYQKYIYRALGAADRVFFNVALQRSLVEQAQVAGKQMGLRGVRLREYVEGIQRGEGVLADHITATALKDANVATFRDQTKLGTAASAVARTLPGGQFIVPFQKTPGAVATRVLEYSPLGLGKGLADAVRVGLRGKNAPAALQRMASEELGRGAVGSGVIALGYWLAHYGLMTGAAPTLGGQDRQQWNQSGRRPNALHIHNQWVEVGRLSPVGNLLALGANLRTSLEKEGGHSLLSPEGASATLFSGLRTVADQPFVSGVTAFGDALQQPDREFARFAQNLAGSVVPAGVGAVARGTDVARMREYEPAGALRGVAGAVMERIPGLRQQLPPQRTSFGDQMPSRGVINAMFSPVTASDDLRKTDPVIGELADADYAVPRLPRHPGEGANAYSQRQRIYGVAARQAVEAVLQSEDYARARQAEVDAVASARQAAADPRVRGYTFEQLRDAALEALKAARGANTRAELLDRAVTQVRGQLKRQLQ